jgi:hypothetical protein
MTRLLVTGPNDRPEISSVPYTVVVIVTVGWLGAPVVIVTNRSITAVPDIVFDADVFAEMPVAPPKDSGAVTVSAFADAAGLDSDTLTTNDVPATYVPLPLNAKTLVIDSAACALIATTTLLVSGPRDRLDISSVPFTVVVIVTDGWLGAPELMEISRSIVPVPLMIFDADPFAERPDAPPKFNDAITETAFADPAGLLNDTRKTNVVPATNVPLPAVHVKPVIARVACALIAMLNEALGPALKGRDVISSPPVTDAVIDTAWLDAPEFIVTRKSM